MARTFDALQEWETYVPAVDGDAGPERELYAEAPDKALTCELRYLTAAQIKGYERVVFRNLKAANQVRDKGEELARRMFTENVRNVRNYAPNGRPLTTGDEVWDDGEPEVINDLSVAMQSRSRLEEGLGKRLSSRSVT